MFKLTITLVISLALLVSFTNAENNNSTEEERSLIEQNEDDSDSTDVGTSRIKHHLLPLYGGSALLGFGGLHALAILYAIKVKIIVVAAVIALSIYYYSKIYLAKSCLHPEIIRDTNPYDSFSSHGPSGYSNSLPSDFSYSGPDPYSAYANIHPDISSIEHLHHHSAGFEDTPHPTSFDHDHHDHESIPDSFPAGSEPGATGAQNSQSTAAAANANAAAAEHTKMTRRIYDQMRQFGNPMFDNINWAEIAFQFLGVDSDGCRRRFTCELDFRMKGSPFTRFVFSMVSPKYFNKYRDLSKDATKPTSFSDCARMHRECKEAEKYDQPDKDIEEVTEPAENGLNEESDRQMHEPLGRLIIRRSEQQ